MAALPGAGPSKCTGNQHSAPPLLHLQDRNHRFLSSGRFFPHQEFPEAVPAAPAPCGRCECRSGRSPFLPSQHPLASSLGAPVVPAPGRVALALALQQGPQLAVHLRGSGAQRRGSSQPLTANTHISFPLLCPPPACLLLDLSVQFSLNCCHLSAR